jgi:protein phosphatase-4 regulatory subunit 3
MTRSSRRNLLLAVKISQDTSCCKSSLLATTYINVRQVCIQISFRRLRDSETTSDTLIVWTEPDGTDYALSFQEVEGCSDVWDYIVDVQRAINGEPERGALSNLMSIICS